MIFSIKDQRRDRLGPGKQPAAGGAGLSVAVMLHRTGRRPPPAAHHAGDPANRRRPQDVRQNIQKSKT